MKTTENKSNKKWQKRTKNDQKIQIPSINLN